MTAIIYSVPIMPVIIILFLLSLTVVFFTTRKVRPKEENYWGVTIFFNMNSRQDDIFMILNKSELETRKEYNTFFMGHLKRMHSEAYDNFIEDLDKALSEKYPIEAQLCNRTFITDHIIFEWTIIDNYTYLH